jgi:hypothetical protein
MYKQFNGNPCGITTGDCVIRAISIAENMPWRHVFLWLCVEGYSDCTFGDVNKTWESYLKYLGYRRHELPNVVGYTVSKFADEHKDGTFIIGTGTHAVAVVNGDIIDSWDSSNEIPLYYFTKPNERG